MAIIKLRGDSGGGGNVLSRVLNGLQGKRRTINEAPSSSTGQCKVVNADHEMPNIPISQEFTIEIKDKKGSKNLAADHLSRLENPELEELDEDAICYSFLDEHLMVVNIKEMETDPWYADYANFLVFKIVPQHLTYHLRKKFQSDVKKYIWDDPYLFKSCRDGIVRRCVFGKELQEILELATQGQLKDNMGPISPQGRSSNQDFIGQPFLNIPPGMFENVMLVKG
ncbi:hypothetical protein Tco_1090180 [Tanacetum coccineum]|uniref:Uncharacterized protein n=1 Tax=Tanacetum coccineum TaxID=301880 RepID=A0ABQ5I538_9ASTR